MTIPESLGSIGGNAFQNCTNLYRVDFKPMLAPTLGSNVFGGVAEGAEVTYPAGATGYTNPFGGLPATVAQDLWYA